MDIIGKLKNIDYINPEDIPNIDLYIDQVRDIILSIMTRCEKALSEDICDFCLALATVVVVCQIKMCDPINTCHKAHLSYFR